MIPHHTKRAQPYKLYPTAAAVDNTIYVRSQMTDNRQHVESTTLQPCCTAAAVGDTIYVRLPCPRYAAASCFCQSPLSFDTPLCRTFLLSCRSGCACSSMQKHRDLFNSNNSDTNPFLYIYVYTGSALTSIFSGLLQRSQMVDSGQHAECKTLQVGPYVRARAVFFLYGGELLFICHSVYLTC